VSSALIVAAGAVSGALFPDPRWPAFIYSTFLCFLAALLCSMMATRLVIDLMGDMANLRRTGMRRPDTSKAKHWGLGASALFFLGLGSFVVFFLLNILL
jgi:hypothetical protein